MNRSKSDSAPIVFVVLFGILAAITIVGIIWGGGR